jgi:hypothetical protein
MLPHNLSRHLRLDHGVTREAARVETRQAPRDARPWHEAIHAIEAMIEDASSRVASATDALGRENWRTALEFHRAMLARLQATGPENYVPPDGYYDSTPPGRA